MCCEIEGFEQFHRMGKLVEEACPAGLHHSGFSCRNHQPKVFFEIPDVTAASCQNVWYFKENLWLVMSAREPCMGKLDGQGSPRSKDLSGSLMSKDSNKLV